MSLHCLFEHICHNTKNFYVQSNLLTWLPLLRDHLSLAATFSGSLEPKYSTNEPVLRGHLSEAATFCPSLGYPLRQI